MPLPLIVPIAVGVAGLFGAGKTVKAVINSKEADKLNDAASYIINNSKDSLELAKGVCSNNLEKLGFKKSYVLNDTVIKFIASFEKLKNVNFQSSVGMDELNKFITDEAKFKEIKEMSILASSIIQGVGGGATAGAAIAFGAYSAVAAFGTASTGTPIVMLSGAAALKATLALSLSYLVLLILHYFLKKKIRAVCYLGHCSYRCHLSLAMGLAMQIYFSRSQIS